MIFAVVGYRQQVNTNLTEISDWLTKIIVGLSLINLDKIPRYLNNAAQTLAVSIDRLVPETHKAFSYALIVCFTILGFLSGYLYTRLYLQGAFSRADQEAAAQKQNETEARVSSLETQVDTQQGLLLESRSVQTKEQSDGQHTIEPTQSASDASPNRDGAMVGLKRMAEEYMNIRVADYTERLRLKNDLDRKVFHYVLKNGISKDDLLREAERSGNEGIVLVLAHYILTSPEVGDMNRLMRVAPGVRKLHVRYRVVQAIGQLFEKHCARGLDQAVALNLLDHYEAGADPALVTLIRGTRSIIDRSVKQGEAVSG